MFVTTTTPSCPAKAGIQYAAATRLDHVLPLEYWITAPCAIAHKADDDNEYAAPHSRDAFARGFARVLRPREIKRAQGMPGACCTRGLVCNSAQKKRTRAYRYSRSIPAFPAQWFYGLWRALPGDEFLLPPSPRLTAFARSGLQTSAGLTPATGARTTRFCRTLKRRSSARDVRSRKPPCEHRIAPDAAASTAFRPNVRDDGERPSSRDGMARDVRLIWGWGEPNYFCGGDWTGQSHLEIAVKIAQSRTLDEPTAQQSGAFRASRGCPHRTGR